MDTRRVIPVRKEDGRLQCGALAPRLYLPCNLESHLSNNGNRDTRKSIHSESRCTPFFQRQCIRFRVRHCGHEMAGVVSLSSCCAVLSSGVSMGDRRLETADARLPRLTQSVNSKSTKSEPREKRVSCATSAINRFFLSVVDSRREATNHVRVRFAAQREQLVKGTLLRDAQEGIIARAGGCSAVGRRTSS